MISDFLGVATFNFGLTLHCLKLDLTTRLLNNSTVTCYSFLQILPVAG